MRMSRQIVVPMFGDVVMSLARGVQRIDVDRDIGQIPQMMQKLVPNLRGDLVPLLHRESWTDGDVHFGMKPVAQPSHAYFGDILHIRRVIHRISGSMPSRRRVKTPLPDSHTMWRMTTVMRRPMMGSAKGKPNQTPMAPRRTAKLVNPSTRA